MAGATETARNRCLGSKLRGKFMPRQHLARMGAARERTIGGGSSIGRRSSGLWPLFEARPLRQMRRPLHDVIFEIGVRDLVLRSLHPAAHGNAGFMNGVGIARNQGMPPVEIAALGHEPVAAARWQPVAGTEVFRRTPDAIRNQVGPVRIVLAGA